MMELQDHEKELIKIYQELKEMNVTDSAIERITQMVSEAYRISKQHENLRVFEDNVRQTQSKQLSSLLKVKKRPILRISAWEETKRHFKQDFERQFNYNQLNEKI